MPPARPQGAVTGLGLFDSFRKIFSPKKADERTSLSRKVQDSPQDPQARQKLGLYLLRLGEIVEGTDQLARAAVLYEKGGFTTKAIAVLRQMLRNDPGSTDFRRWLIRLLAQQGHIKDAQNELQKIAAGEIRFPTDEAKIEFYRAVSESLPQNPLPSILIADIYLYQRKLFEAIGELGKAAPFVDPSGMGEEFEGRMNVLASLAGENESLLEPCGFLWLAVGKDDFAMPLLEKALQTASGDGGRNDRNGGERVLALLREGKTAGLSGAMSFAEALKRLSDPGAAGPADAEEGTAIAGAPREDMALLQEAVERLREKVKEEIGESDPEARYNLGIAYKEMGLLEEAAEEFRLSRSNPSLFLGASCLLAETLAAKGDLDAAIRTLDEVLALEGIGAGESRDVRYDKAVFLSRAGREEEAMEIFLSLHEEAPDYRDLRERVRRIRE